VEIDHLKEWLKRGYHHKMKYMERNLEKRENVRTILQNAESVISLAKNYFTDEQYSLQNGFGKVSRYAWGKDYHLVLWEKLYEFIEDLKEIDPEFGAVSYVDTGPVMDKAWAVKSGIGWLGKHTNVITKEFGSWIFLASVITSYKFEPKTPSADFCGTCAVCIDTCPTNAIAEQYVLDAGRCISNLTIENRGEISTEFKEKFDNWLFGCDICQDVCPWNKKFSEVTTEKEFFPHGNKEIELSEIMGMTQNKFKKRFADSPIKRAKLKGFKRNAKFLNE
ncbi:MAG: tRNA epoxyqueuosine(34) reductase QueG, partial [Ignavibacteria bacterium RBG_13_36_8]